MTNNLTIEKYYCRSFLSGVGTILEDCGGLVQQKKKSESAPINLYYIYNTWCSIRLWYIEFVR